MQFVREYTPLQREAFARNALVPHDHSWMGGEVITETEMPGEPRYYEREWYCQFCGVRCRGETLDYAAKRTLLPAVAG